MAEFDRLDIIEAHYLFLTEHHEGQGSESYSKLSTIGTYYTPSFAGPSWESLSPNARDIYRDLCKRENVDCEYDTLKWCVENLTDFDIEDPCVEAILDRYGDEDYSILADFDRSDWVNMAECYTRDLLNRYSMDEEAIKYWFNEYCEELGVTSTLEALEGHTIEDPEDMITQMVNLAMTYCAQQIHFAVTGAVEGL
jgi:hypothetical protein